MLAESFENYPILVDFLGYGLIVTVIMAIINWVFIDESTFEIDGEYVSAYRVIYHWINIISLHLAVMFCISTIGGIIDAMWIAPIWFGLRWADLTTVFDYIVLVAGIVMVCLFPAFLTYVVGYWVMGLHHFTKKYSQVIFLATFLVSILFWCNYIDKYDANIEITTESQQVTEERELILFYEIPVQEVSGEFYGSFVRGNGELAGEIFSIEKIPYLYFNEEGKGEWDYVPIEYTDITFITEKDKPKIVIVTNIWKEIKVNHNTGTSTVTDESYSYEYHFYLPKTLIQTFEAE